MIRPVILPEDVTCGGTASEATSLDYFSVAASPGTSPSRLDEPTPTPPPAFRPEDLIAMSDKDLNPSGKGWRPAPIEPSPPATIQQRRGHIVARPGHFVGEAHNVEQRSSFGARNAPPTLVRNFRVVAYDGVGNRLSPVQVEMSGLNFTGMISEGDWVEVPGTPGDGSAMFPATVYNHTTRTLICSQSGNRLLHVISILWGLPFYGVAILMSLGFLVGFYYIIYAILFGK